MIDIHTHVLPGIDDGPKTLAESIKLLKMFEARKVKIIIATSHITRNSPPVSEYLKAYTELNIEKEKQKYSSRFDIGVRNIFK